MILLQGQVAAWLSRRHIAKIAFLLDEVNMLGVLGASIDLVLGVIFPGHAAQARR